MTKTSNAMWCWCSIGRIPFTDGLGLDHVGVEIPAWRDPGRRTFQDQCGRIAPSATSFPALLAHKAEEGALPVSNIWRIKRPASNDAIPSVVYMTQAASVGRTEESSKRPASITARAVSRSWRIPGRGNGDTEGFVKMLADATTDEVLGVPSSARTLAR